MTTPRIAAFKSHWALISTRARAGAATLCPPRRQRALGLSLLAILLLPPVRHALEASMARHMLVQFPLLLCGGALLVANLSSRTRAFVDRWNAHGISGLVGVSLALAVLMVPRVLDLALIDPVIEIAKCTALVLAGGALRLSWRPAGMVVQAFFLGNVLPMTAVVGQLYIDSPVRVCNAYLLDDQALLGQWLVRAAIVLAALWLMQVARALTRQEVRVAPPSAPDTA